MPQSLGGVAEVDIAVGTLRASTLSSRCGRVRPYPAAWAPTTSATSTKWCHATPLQRYKDGKAKCPNPLGGTRGPNKKANKPAEPLRPGLDKLDRLTR